MSSNGRRTPKGVALFVAGDFATVGGQPRTGLAVVDAGTGALDPEVDIAFTVPRQGNEPRVETIGITPDGATLVAGGNFTVVDGQSRWQAALVDVASRPARLLAWKTDTAPGKVLRLRWPSDNRKPRDHQR